MLKMIATWRMALEALQAQYPLLKQGACIDEVLVEAVSIVEDNPYYHSVGYGGLPNAMGVVELDAAFMQGKSLAFGGVMGVSGIKNPIRVARLLADSKRNTLLTAYGAEIFAQKNGFIFQNMLTPMAAEKWQKESSSAPQTELREAYDGHDTVCILGVDQLGHSSVAVSTSGLFMKHPGRIGDSPIIGSGFYADGSVGAAAATGVGEDIMKGCLSYEICRLMEEGLAPNEACAKSLSRHQRKLEAYSHKAGSMSVIAMNKNGDWGVATNKKEFSFVVAENDECTVYLASCGLGGIQRATRQWLENYDQNLKKGSGI